MSSVIEAREGPLAITEERGDGRVYVLTDVGLTGATGPAAWQTVAAWLTATAYSASDPKSVVIEGGETYVCATSHTSGVFATDLAAVKWVKVAAKGSDGFGLTDGDKGDITVSASGATFTIDAGAVTLAKQADMATASLVYRKTAGAGAPEVQTLATLKTDLGLTGTNSGDQTITLTGDVTGTGVGSFAATIANNAVTLAKMATMATDSILGRATAATGNVEVLTALPFAFTGDVTRPADSNALTIANDAVTYAKMQNVTATDKLLGRSTAGAGDVEEIACTAAGRALLDDADATAQRTTLGLGTIATLAAPSGTVVGTTDTQTLSAKRITPRVNAQTTTASPWAWNSDSYDQQSFSALANALTINADAGTPVDGQKTILRFKDNGTARALTWTTGASKAFRAIGVTLPTTTVISKTTYVGCVYNGTDARWDAIAVAQEA